jgi:hypothetical protein
MRVTQHGEAGCSARCHKRRSSGSRSEIISDGIPHAQPVTEMFLDAVNSHEKHGSFFRTEPEHRLESRRIAADF